MKSRMSSKLDQIGSCIVVLHVPAIERLEKFLIDL